MTRITIHSFESTSAAYDETQWNDDIRDGDVLVVESENVVGVLVGAWPTAVTDEHGSFHTLADGQTWQTLRPSEWSKLDGYSESAELARKLVGGGAICGHCRSNVATHRVGPTEATPHAWNVCASCINGVSEFAELTPLTSADAPLGRCEIHGEPLMATSVSLECAACVALSTSDVRALARLSVRGTDVSRAAASAKLEELRLAELRALPFEAFEGDAESGPMTPMTSVQRAISDAHVELYAERTDALLRDAMIATDDVLFAVAADVNVSPLYVLRRAGKLGLLDRVTRDDEKRVSERMARESDARRDAESGR